MSETQEHTDADAAYVIHVKLAVDRERTDMTMPRIMDMLGAMHENAGEFPGSACLITHDYRLPVVITGARVP